MVKILCFHELFWGEVRELFHHHDHEKQLTAAEREQLLSTGAAIQGMVHRNEPSPADRLISQVSVRVDFKGGQTVDLNEELAILYRPEPGSPEAKRLAEVRNAEQLRHPDRIPKIQLPLSLGERIPVRYDTANPARAVIDVPALQKRALRDYIQREKQSKGQPPAGKAAGIGPPWIVPAHCPNCGAPIDQATASQARDPYCEFCHQPVPVQPAH